MGSTMKTSHRQFKSSLSKVVLSLLAAAGILALAPARAQAGNVAWAVSVGGGYGGGYGGGWRPAAYGPGWVAVAGVQAGGVDITVPVMAIHMLLATMLHPWFTQAPR